MGSEGLKDMIHLYCGDGKGKTTAAAGCALRAAGNNMKVLFVQFLNYRDSGELKLLDKMENVKVLRETAKMYSTEHDQAQTLSADLNYTLASFSPDLLILDDATKAVEKKLFSSEILKTLINEHKKSMEIIITGTLPELWMIEIADYVTDMEKLKHPYDTSMKKHKGIKY